jgi:two-component system LytT family sensor kinase
MNLKKFLPYIIIFSAALFALGLRYYFLFPQMKTEYHWYSFCFSLAVITSCWELIKFLNKKLNVVMPFSHGVTKRIIVQIALSLLSVLPIIITLLSFILDYLPPEMTKIVSATFYLLYFTSTCLINAGFFADHFFDQWKKSILHSTQLEKEKARVQYDNLKNQLNPHFLFNSLTSLDGLIYKNQELASAFLHQLSRVYRYVLENKEKELVSLKTEVTFVRNYIELLMTRFDDGLIIDMNVSEEALERNIVPVTLQIMIENALKHNIIDQDTPLKIYIYDRNEYLFIENNLQKKTQVEFSNKQGLDNFKNLYLYLSNKKVEIEETSEKFSIGIPLI